MKNFIDFIVKNKYVIICVSIVVLLYALGVIDILWKLIVLVALVVLAVFVGKKLQEDETIIKKIFKWKKEDVYYYQDDEKTSETKKTSKK